jgi:hypothetical protein
MLSMNDAPARSPPLWSSLPRRGSWTVRKMTTPTTMPGMPSTRKTVRQLKASLIIPAMSAPSQAPIGAPSENMVSAIGRRAAGK